MDCKAITQRLTLIKREADTLKKMLDNGNTGFQFDNYLHLVELHVQVIRAEVASPVPVAKGERVG